MLLPSLYEFAKRTRMQHGGTILDFPEFNSRYVSWLIDITSDGKFRGFVPLWTDDAPGTLYHKLPRTVEPKDSGTIAEFLVEDVTTILGIGDAPSKPMKDKALEKHKDFWRRVEEAATELDHPGLKVVVSWKQKVLGKNPIPNVAYEVYKKRGSRSQPKEQWLLITPSGDKHPLYFRPNTSIDATFRVDGSVLVLEEAILEWWSRWFHEWVKTREEACWAAHGHGRICVVTGEMGAPISNSHLPKIKGPMIQSFGATLASSEAASFHSYGLSEQKQQIPGTRRGPDASYANVSVKAAIAYCNALNYLLEDEDHHIVLGPLGICMWAKEAEWAPGQFKAMLAKAYPEQVKKFLRAPFAGVADREVLNRDRLYTVALAGNAGRVVVQHWLDQTLDEAVSHFAKWWDDLQIVSVYQPASADKKGRAKKTTSTEPPPSPFAIPNLARVMLRQTKDQRDDKLVAERVVQLYRAALEGTSLPITMLKPILDEFHSALVKDDEKKPTYPFSQSRFALIKLILIRNRRKEDEFMPTYDLADTSDTAYNLGRLLAVFEELQDRYHNYEKKGPGVVERYYATASSAPASAFPILCRLARHHLSKVRREDEKAAYWIEKRITEVMSKFQSASLGKPPTFPRVLTLEEQGRFALGFYQQKASRNKSAEKADRPAEQSSETE